MKLFNVSKVVFNECVCLFKNNSLFLILDISLTYLETWSEHLKPFIQSFNWIELRELPLWATGSSPVKTTVEMLITKNVLQKEEHDAIFNEMVHVKTYLKEVPLENGKNVFDIWNENQTPLEQRWMQVFTDLKKKSVSFEVFAKLIEYVLMIPGKQTLFT